jgi:hypothetical protein
MSTETPITAVSIESLLNWGPPQPGLAMALRIATITPEFRQLYFDNTEAFHAGGVTVISPTTAKWWTSWEDYRLSINLNTFSPKSLEPLYPPPHHQQPHCMTLGQAFVNVHAVLDGSDTGTGKTPVSAVLCRELGLQPLIVCKKSGMENWRQWCKDLGINPLGIWNYEKAKIGYAKPYYDPETGKFALTESQVLIVDEVHKCSNKDTQNAAMLVAAKSQGCKILALSATAGETPLKLYALGYALGLHVPRKTWTTFLERHGCYYVPKVGWEWRGNPDDMKLLHSEIYPERGSRMRKSEIPNYPTCQVVAEPYDMGKDEARIQKMWKENVEEFERLKQNSLYAEGAAKLTAALQLSELSKVGFLCDEARELVEEGLSVAIAVRFTESRKKIMERLKCDGIYGDQTEAERVRAIDLFQKDINRVIVVNMQAGSDSISLNDTHGNHPRVGLTCPTFSAIDLIQWFGRLNRANDKSPALYRLIYAKGTPEEKACRAVQMKINNHAAFNDGDLMAGVQLMK